VTPPTQTVSYMPYRYTGWRRIWRKITLRPVESPTYEFEAIMPGTTWYDEESGSDNTTFSMIPVGPVRRVDP
jgi:hypothetical protein